MVIAVVLWFVFFFFYNFTTLFSAHSDMQCADSAGLEVEMCDITRVKGHILHYPAVQLFYFGCSIYFCSGAQWAFVRTVLEGRP